MLNASGYYVKFMSFLFAAVVLLVTPVSSTTLAMINKPLIASVIDELPSSLSKACGFVRIAGCEVHVLFDTCSSESFIHSRLVDWRKRKVWPSSETISMAASAFSTEIKGHACMYQGQEYTHVPLGV